MKNKNILITGGFGYIGGRLSSYLSKKGHNLIISTRQEVSKDTLNVHNNIKRIMHEQLLKPEDFPEGIDVIIHLAALNEIDSVKHPSLAVNINIDHTRIILENAILKKVKRFVYFSTVHVYGATIQNEIDEDTLPRPSHPYAITHRAAEDFVIAAHDKERINAQIIRLSNSFGAPVRPNVDRWSLLINDICKQLVTTGNIKLNSNGCQSRDFITLTDVEEFIGYLMNINLSNKNNIINLVSGRTITVLEMANLIARCFNQVTGMEASVILPPNSTRTLEPKVNYSTKQLEKTGYILKNDFEKELKALILFCLKHFT